MESVTQFFETKARLFEEGELHEAAKSISVPSAIFLPDRRLVVQTQDEMVAVIETLRSRLVALGYAHTQVEIVQCDRTGSGRLNVLVRWIHLNARMEPISESKVNYFCRANQQGDLRIELVEFHSMPGQPIKPVDQVVQLTQRS